jgi:hypothetical protein
MCFSRKNGERSIGSMRLPASIRTPGGALRNFNIVGLEGFYDRPLS